MKDYTEVDLEISVAQYFILKENYVHPKKLYVLVEPGRETTITKEAREFSSRPESNAMTRAIAVVNHSLAQRMVINVIITFIRKQTKMRAFSNVDEAVAWLLAYKERNGE